jgi:hypothetical protein
MSFLRPIQWYHSHADPIWPDGTLKDPTHRSFTDSMPCEKSILLWNLFLETSIPCEGIKDFQIVVVMCYGGGGDTPIGQHISNTLTVWYGME